MVLNMSKIEKLTALVGKTPLLHLSEIHPNIWGKLEYRNPLGSVKDRPTLFMLRDALASGKADKNTTIVESTSGNTGVALGFICTNLGLKLTITMPESMRIERRKLLSALGAELVLTPKEEGMRGAIERAKEICEEKNGYMVGQFENPANVEAHRKTTGPERLADMTDGVDIFVAGVGTGGTLTGCGEVLKAANSNTKIVAVEPAESPVLSGGKPSLHKIQGIGAGFVPKILNRGIIDEIVTVTGDEAAETSRLLGKRCGLLSGISSGAALKAALKLADMAENRNKKIVVILPDTGERYLSTDLFD